MKRKEIALIIFSFLAIYIIWGSTYLFAAFCIEQIPAFRVCGLRYTIASIIIFLFLFLFGIKEKPNAIEIKNAITAGFIFLGLGTGGAIWALNYVDTGLAALIIAGEPLIIVLMMWAFEKKKPVLQSFLGIALGIFGMYLLMSQKEIISNEDQWLGMVAILLSMLAWGGGSLYVKNAKLPKSQFLNSAIQMMSGGLFTFFISVIIQEQSTPFQELNMKTHFSLWFLIIFGSIIAFTSFNYLLKVVSTEKVVTNTYVNPIIAMILGYYFRDEIVTQQSIIAACVLILGVFIINSNKSNVSKVKRS